MHLVLSLTAFVLLSKSKNNLQLVAKQGGSFPRTMGGRNQPGWKFKVKSQTGWIPLWLPLNSLNFFGRDT